MNDLAPINSWSQSEGGDTHIVSRDRRRPGHHQTAVGRQGVAGTVPPIVRGRYNRELPNRRSGFGFPVWRRTTGRGVGRLYFGMSRSALAPDPAPGMKCRSRRAPLRVGQAGGKSVLRRMPVQAHGPGTAPAEDPACADIWSARIRNRNSTDRDGKTPSSIDPPLHWSHRAQHGRWEARVALAGLAVMRRAQKRPACWETRSPLAATQRADSRRLPALAPCQPNGR